MEQHEGGHLNQETVEIKSVHSNLSQEVVKITVDKLRLILNEYLADVECRKDWIAPLGILVTLIVVVATTDFKTAWLSADSWRAFFLLVTLVTVGWLIRASVRAFRSKSVSDIIEKIKSGNP